MGSPTIGFIFLIAFVSPAFAQPTDSQPTETRRARRNRLPDTSPDDRRSRRLRRMIESAARTYELTDAQKEQVRMEVEAMQRDRITAMGPEAERYDRLREQVRRAMREMPENETREQRRERLRALREDPKLQEARDQLREIEQKFPFRWQDALKRIEAALPPDQVAKAHAKSEERRRRWEERRQERERQRGANAPLPEPGTAPSELRGSQRSRAERRTTTRHPWDAYVQKFAAEHALSPSQQTGAQAILNDQKARLAQLEKANTEKLAAVEQIQNIAERKRQIAELNRPKDQLFEEMKSRLESLLTSDQRAKARSR